MSVGDLTELHSKIAEIERVSDQEWQQSLSKRKIKELEFHDQNRDRQAMKRMDQDTYERFYGNKKYYSATDASRKYVEGWLASEARDRIFLDYACGNGQNAVRAAQEGAKLAMGLDISPISVSNAAKDAAAAGVASNTRFFQADAENTRLPTGSIERAICSGMLHHLDLSYAFPELRRILAPGGRILVHEALDYNPLIKLYRHLTPDMRTEWEKAHILSHKDVRFARHFFNVENIRYWHLLGIAAPHVPWLAPTLQGIDRVLEKIPGVQLMSWIFTFELVRRDD